MTVRLALIGAGRWGRVFINTITQMDGCSLTAVASGNPQSQELLPAECRVDKDWRAVATAVDVDGVIIATPPHTHREIAETAMSAGKATIIEKPLTLSLSDAVALRDVAAESDALCFVDHTHLYHPAFREICARVQGERIDLIRTEAGNHGPFRSDTPVLWDWGPHDVAMCLALLKESPTGVKAHRTIASNANGERGETWTVELAFADRATAHIQISNLQTEKSRRFEIQSSAGDYIYDDLTSEKLWQRTSDGNNQPIEIDPTPPVTLLIQRFVEAIDAGSTDHSGLELAVDVVRVLAACDTAAMASEDTDYTELPTW